MVKTWTNTPLKTKKLCLLFSFGQKDHSHDKPQVIKTNTYAVTQGIFKRNITELFFFVQSFTNSIQKNF